MADAACGPSNPLQNFRKQTQTDRSLQQDRLASRNQPAQGFRSSPGPNAGILDAEFEAFQNGAPIAIPPQDLHHGPVHGAQPFQPQQFSGGPSSSAWATDFQRLHISQPPPLQQHHHAPQPTTTSWHNDFIQQNRSTSSHLSQTSFQPQMSQQYPSTMGYAPSLMRTAPMMHGSSLEQSGFSQKGKEKEAFDDAAFERAFEMHASQAFEEQAQFEAQEQASREAAAADELHRTQEQQSARSHYEASMDPLKEWAQAIKENEVEETIHNIEAERLREEPVQEAQQHLAPPDVDQDLARTAGELLERVADDQNEKFLNSEFFSLMRRVRDGEATIRDGQMLDGDVRNFSSPQYHAPDDWDKD
ncbi:hypothetical protein FH972_022075 [Carpinus fangiana]|uniref:Peroxin 20 n=1 Tax=Carpinus fangiana TaxID=176857 RepID=A0A5N6KRR3_9ROSI|nr:hypothetical protein FH972_022075 [Carpinus fangiana]